MRKFIVKHVPIILSSFLKYLIHRSLFLRTSVIPAMIEGIIDHDTQNINVMSPVIGPEIIKRVFQ